MRRISLMIVLTVLAAAPARAQIEQCTRYAELIDAVVAGQHPRAPDNLVNISLAPRCFLMFVAGLDGPDRFAFKDFVRRFESFRSDKQTGASGAGATSIVALGPTAKILSVAAEYGALTQSVNKQVVTVRGNLAGFPSALVRKDLFPYCVGSEAVSGYCVDKSLLGVLRRFSFGVSFDPSRTQMLAATPVAAGSGNQGTSVAFRGSGAEISTISVRVDVLNRRDASSAAFTERWRAKVGAATDRVSADLLDAADFVVDVMDLPEHDAWFTTSAAAVRAAGNDRKKVIAALTSSLTQLASAARKAPGYDGRVASALAAYSRFFLAQDDLIELLATKNVLVFEYTHNRPALQARTSNYKLILDYPLSKETKLVTNAALTFYDSVPPDQHVVTRLRDVQAALQLDRALGDVAILGPAVFSVAGYFQYQHSPAVLKVDPAAPIAGVTFIDLPAGAKEVFARTGNIWLFQGRLSLVPSGSSVTIPLAVTWSNRNELVDKPQWRGQVGVSYNVDALFAALTGR